MTSVTNSIAERVSQTVLFGSVDLAVHQHFIKIDDILEWLSTRSEENDEITIAYNMVCKIRPPNTHYLRDGVHLLVKNRTLAAVAVKYGFDPSIRSHKEGESRELWNYVFETMMKATNDNDTKARLNMLFKGTGNDDFLRRNLKMFYAARFWRELPRVSSDVTNDALLASDWVIHLRHTGQVAKQLLQRVTFLQKHAPQYYSQAAYKSYYDVAMALHKEKLLINLKQSELQLFDTYFTNIVDQQLLSYDALCYGVASLTTDIAGYILGFPIQCFIPNEEQIHTALVLLKAKGLQEYCAHIKPSIAPSYLPTGIHATEDFTYSNSEDVIGENIDDYTPFDIVAFRNGKHIYRFTRMEFARLAETKKNHWTNEWLPPSILCTIKARIATARELGLPNCRTMKEHLQRVQDGTFFQSDDAKPATTPTQSPFANIAAQMNWNQPNYDEISGPVGAFRPQMLSATPMNAGPHSLTEIFNILMGEQDEQEQNEQRGFVIGMDIDLHPATGTNFITDTATDNRPPLVIDQIMQQLQQHRGQNAEDVVNGRVFDILRNMGRFFTANEQSSENNDDEEQEALNNGERESDESEEDEQATSSNNNPPRSPIDRFLDDLSDEDLNEIRTSNVPEYIFNPYNILLSVDNNDDESSQASDEDNNEEEDNTEHIDQMDMVD